MKQANWYELKQSATTPIWVWPLVCGLLLASSASAGEWPQILGPARNGVAQQETLGDWTNKPPQTAWTAKAGAGYGGVAIANGAVVVFHRVGEHERLEAFDLAKGRSLWKADFAASYRGGIDPDLGPRTVPLIAGERVFAYGAGGDMLCVRLKTGEKLWSRALASDYEAPDGYFGAGSSPIVAENRLWINVGGKGAGIVALDLATGETRFRGTDELASYSSPTYASINGNESLVFVTRYKCLGIDPKSGDVQFRFPFGKRGPTVNAATPLVFDDRLFVSASYGVGARLMKFTGREPTAVWENDTSMSSQYTTCVFHQGYLYGVDGREDVGDANLRCIEAASGDVQWKEDGFGIAHVILVGDRLLVVRQNGEILQAPATPKGFTPSGTAQLVKGTIRALPALAQGRLVVRTVATGGEGAIVAIDVR